MYFGDEKDKAAEEVRVGEKVVKGVIRKFLYSGERIQMVQLEAKAGTEFPEHAHFSEQAGYIIKGKFEVNIGGQRGILEKGHYFFIPANVLHSGIVHKDAILIDIYSPPR